MMGSWAAAVNCQEAQRSAASHRSARGMQGSESSRRGGGMRYIFDDYVLDTQRHELHHAGEPVPLRRRAFQVLAYLLTHRDRVVAKQELLEQLWPDQFIGDAALTSCIKTLRQALGERGRTARFLRTLHGQGYRFVAPVEERAPLPADTAPQATPSPAPALHPLASQEAGAPVTWEAPQPMP